MREAVWGRHLFLGEEGREEDKEGKRVEHSPWRRAGRAADNGAADNGVAVLVDTSVLKGMVADIEADIEDVTVLMAKESSPLSPPQSTEASLEPA